MKVIAATGLKVPKEDAPRDYITDSEPVEIEATAYYIRRMADGELTEVVGEQANPTEGTASSVSKSAESSRARK